MDPYLEGLEEKFHVETGTRVSEEYFVRGDRQGDSKRWDASGNLTRHVRYGPAGAYTDLMQPQPAANVDACTDKWLAAHRKAVGPDAPVRMEQLDEWETWCRAGKQPT